MKPRVLIVDGHSMIFQWPDLADLHARKSAAAREELVRRLRGLQDASDWTVAVVFDGRGAKASDASEPGGIHIFYSKAGQTADSVIERLAAKYALTCDVTVATDDRLERVTAEAFGSSSMSCMQLRLEIEAADSAVGREIEKLRRRR
ncbi:MAG: NYN domain-containing protein [Terrimicrobiaceae bacterium]|nr:NYN domain-containing protein [Terrimicrobiaceae bacterium]